MRRAQQLQFSLDHPPRNTLLQRGISYEHMILDAVMNDQSPHNQPDQELIERIVAKDSEGISVLYDRYAKLLYGIIVAVVRDTDDAEDALQEVFVQLWNRAHTYQPELSSPKTWLVRMAHNRAIDFLRSKRYQQRKVEVGGIEDGDSVPGVGSSFVENTTWSQTVHHEQSTQISAALSQLPHEQRSLIDLAFLQGFTHHEISRDTGIPLGTVKTRIRSGMQRLRSHLGYIAEEM